MATQGLSRLAISKWGGANFLDHPNDGMTATAVIEYETEQESNWRC